ncbi:helix-turn-helix domain-containing protein [Rhodoferax sp.]|uniref:helix-turn-helix domain-containing protein n=1 Tax=Rhodoferax sp. TaxID=50421 RepID=UPI002729D1DD|nr:helix-turn-helix domain-containing protein [Rhodoferax sp.]
MSESVLPSSDDRASAQDSMAQISGGAMLRKAREAAGLHIAALAVALKVPVKKLEALETDRFDLLPDIVFVRALASSVCRTLKIDPEPILARLPHTTATYLKTDASGINVPFRASSDASGLTFWDQLSKPVVLAVLALLLGVLVLVFFPFAQRIEIASGQRSEVAPVGVSQPAPAPQATDSPAPVEVAVPVQSPSLTASDSVASLATEPASAATATASPMQGAATALPVTVVGSGATSGLVVFKARGASWVEVVDASGVVQLRKTMADGDVIGASGAVPLSVVVGRADTTVVEVRGKPFDLTRVARDNVARFEVK